ncbi:glycosyltransferase family 4 protein [Cellulomonas sp. ICMP 17802]|uniref:glycosyltransferase family 4 protein n=1 Tax=Cellulomonas sp. ICMP 17802 TaxID=3239199 RepID=UPI00351B55EC
MTRLRVVHVARDIVGTGGGEVVRQVTALTAARGVEVVLVTDSTDFVPAPGVTVKTVAGGGALIAWQPEHRIGWHVRHALQIAWFTVASSMIALPLRMRGYVVFNHNCESLVGQVLVMHNVFSAELTRRHLSRPRMFLAYLNPVRAIRIAKERVLAAPVWGRRLLAVSQAALPDVVALAGGHDRVSVTPNGVDLTKFSAEPGPIDVLLAQQLVGSRTVVLFIGHEFARKGLPELIAALAGMPSDTILLVAGGESQDRERYRIMAEKSGVASNVVFLGRVDDVRPVLGVADVFCLPSHYETMPLVALEALAAGVPIVLTPECPAHRLIVSGANGEVTSHDPEEIGRAIAKAALVVKGDAVRASVAEMSWERTTAGYLQVAEGIATRGSVARRRRVAA